MRANWGMAAAVAVGLVALATGAQAQTFRAASANEGVDIVTADDAYMRGLTPSDLSIRLQTRDSVSTTQLKAVYAAGVTAWSEAETARLNAMVERNKDKLATLNAWLPAQVLFIKGSRAIDGGLPHTRANAIVFGPTLPLADAALDGLFWHELFHILSRTATRPTRESLYALIGFERCESVSLPANLRARGLSNPDVEDSAYTVEIAGAGGPVDVMPFLTANPERYDAAKPAFPSYIQLMFLNIARGPQGTCTLKSVTGETSMFAPAAVQAPLFAKVGRNTHYVFHAEETLADNFSYLMLGRTDLPDMWVIEKLKERLAQGPN